MGLDCECDLVGPVVVYICSSVVEVSTKAVMAKKHGQIGQPERQLQVVGSGSDAQGTYAIVVRPHQDDDELWRKLRHSGPRWFCDHRGEEMRVVFQDEIAPTVSAPARRPNSTSVSILPSFSPAFA